MNTRKMSALAVVPVASVMLLGATGTAQAVTAPKPVPAVNTVPAAGSTGPSQIIAPGTKGSDVWISWSGAQPYLMGRYSWSYMWYMKANATNHQLFVSAACTFVPAGPFSPLAKAACTVAVNIYYNYMKTLITVGLANKTCFQYRVPITSPSNTTLIATKTQFSLVRCVR